MNESIALIGTVICSFCLGWICNTLFGLRKVKIYSHRIAMMEEIRSLQKEIACLLKETTFNEEIIRRITMEKTKEA